MIRRNINFIVSPFSVWSLLVLLAEGADGKTYDELRHVLRLPSDLTYVRMAYRNFQRLLVVNTPTIELAVNQAIYTDSNHPIQPNYANVLERDYGADHIRVNFRNSQSAVQQINEFVKQQTHGKILDLVREDDVRNAQMVLTSAIYFKGQWKVKYTKLHLFYFLYII